MLSHASISGVRDDTEPGDDTVRFSVRSKCGGGGGGGQRPQPQQHQAGVTMLRVDKLEPQLRFLGALQFELGFKFVQYASNRGQYRDAGGSIEEQIECARGVLSNAGSFRALERAVAQCRDEALRPRMQLQLADALMFGLLGVPQRDPNRACSLYYEAGYAGDTHAMTAVAIICLAQINVSLGRTTTEDRERVDPSIAAHPNFAQLFFWVGSAAERNHFSPFAFSLVHRLGPDFVRALSVGKQALQGASTCLRLYTALAAKIKLDRADSFTTNQQITRANKQHQPGAAPAAAALMPVRQPGGDGAPPAAAPAAAAASAALPTVVCCDCQLLRIRADFAAAQLKKPAAARRCRDCSANKERQQLQQQQQQPLPREEKQPGDA